MSLLQRDSLKHEPEYSNAFGPKIFFQEYDKYLTNSALQ